MQFVASNFAHLHLHSNYSLHQGCVSIDSLIEQAVEYKMDTLALTDVNNLYCAVEFYEKCIDANIKPIIGTEKKKKRLIPSAPCTQYTRIQMHMQSNNRASVRR